MFGGLVLFAALASTQRSHVHRPVVIGWHDEFNDVRSWRPLDVDNKAYVTSLKPGTVHLWLERVPSDWPFAFQWSGVTREAPVDIERFPILLARVTTVQGYAHMDIDVLNHEGQAIKTVRSSTLVSPGVSEVDLSRDLALNDHNVRVRLIVGGENTGCSATYDWVRFVAAKDKHLFTDNSGFSDFVSYSPWKTGGR